MLLALMLIKLTLLSYRRNRFHHAFRFGTPSCCGYRTDRSLRNYGAGNDAYDRRSQTVALMELLTAGAATPPVLANVRFAPLAAVCPYQLASSSTPQLRPIRSNLGASPGAASVRTKTRPKCIGRSFDQKRET
jgi:hypothetical protein